MVGAAVDGLARQELGRHEGKRAHEGAGAREASARVDRERQTEVDDVGLIVRRVALLLDQDVGRLNVAMDDPLGVRSVERRCDLARDVDSPAKRQRPVALDEIGEVAVADDRHGDEELALPLARVVDRDDVRVVNGRSEAVLAQNRFWKMASSEISRARSFSATSRPRL